MCNSLKRKRRKYRKLDPTIVCKVSPYVYLQYVALMVVFAVAMVIVAVKFDRLWLIVLPILFALGGGLYCLTCIKFTVLTFTQGKLIAKTGVLSSSLTEIPAVNILSITVDKGAISHIFHYGNILVKTANGDYRFDKMARPDEFVSKASEYLVDITRRS